MAKAIQHDQIALSTQLSAACAAGIRSVARHLDEIMPMQ
jgi:hypothetical protein